MKLIKGNQEFDPQGYFLDCTEDHQVLRDPTSVDLFDQNGYHLTKAEQSFLNYNGYDKVERRHEDCLRHSWFTATEETNVHINHSDLFERKGFRSNALEQIEVFAVKNPKLYKLYYMKPKWGIDISIDYCDKDKAYELFHYEYDSFTYEEVQQKKLEIEELVLRLDWNEVAVDFWELRRYWGPLDFFSQSKWRTDYFGIEPERFKNVIWDN